MYAIFNFNLILIFFKNKFFFKASLVITFFGFKPSIILKLFLNIEGVTTSENQRIIFKSLLMSYFIIKQKKSGTE